MVRTHLLSTLDRKLIRDLRQMWGQALAISMVVAAGIAVLVVMTGMLASLSETRQAYYERYRFADLWINVVRAPNSVVQELRAIEGIGAIEARITAPVLFDMPSMDEPASGVIHSLPSGGHPAVSDLHLVSGSLPDPTRPDEVVVLDGFATAHELNVGSTLNATIRGRRERFKVSGIVLSPEYVYAIAPGQLVPDPGLFGVLWMDREALETAADLEGAFNDVAIRLMREADPEPVKAALERILEPYGTPGAYSRREQISDAFLSSELQQLETMGRLMPPIFLLVAAFLVNIVISRLIAVEREQIGLLKAFGYSSVQIAIHYLKLAGIIGFVGLVIGIGVGTWLGRGMALMYAQYYAFPFLLFALTPSVYAISILTTMVAVGGGAFWSVRQAAKLEPAIAMRPPPPPDYSHAAGSAIVRIKAIDHQTRMILRQILRWPVRAGLTISGMALSGAMLVMSLYFLDAMEVMIESYFDIANRHDISVSFAEARNMSAYYELTRREGVLEAEPYRVADARLRFENREVRMGLTGVVPDPVLSRMIDSDDQVVAPPPGGLVLSADLAGRLGAQTGDTILAEITTGEQPVLELPIVATPVVLIGSGAQMRLEDLNAALGEDAVVSGAYLRVDPVERARIYTELKEAPLVVGVGLHVNARENFTEIMDRSMGTSILIYTGFAGLIALGVIYNSIRVSLAERQRELASLRVLGFTRAEVSYILLGEAGLLTLLSFLPALVMGSLLALWMSDAMGSDFFRLPYIIEAGTYGYTVLVLTLIALASALIVRRRIDRLDLVEVLKTRE